MTNKARQKAEYTKVKKELFKLLEEFNTNEELRMNHPILQRITELGRDKHLSLEKAVKAACEEFGIK